MTQGEVGTEQVTESRRDHGRLKSELEKAPGTDGFTAEFWVIFKEQITVVITGKDGTWQLTLGNQGGPRTETPNRALTEAAVN